MKYSEEEGVKNEAMRQAKNPHSTFHIPQSAEWERYHIPVKTALTPWELGKFMVERADSCINCGKCISACIYGVHFRRPDDVRRLDEPRHSLCRDCFRCVEECPVGALKILPNPVYLGIGDEFIPPWLVQLIWQQAETGRVPVSGAGFRGPFGGPGWDGMWTDMSEIVRPTRDGIHGREYISTDVEIRRNLPYLKFTPDGRLASPILPSLRLPIPILFSLPSVAEHPRPALSLLRASKLLGTLAILAEEDFSPELEEFTDSIFLHLREWRTEKKTWAKAFEVDYQEGFHRMVEQIRHDMPGAILSVRLPLIPSAESAIEDILKENVEMVHLVADPNGFETPPLQTGLFEEGTRGKRRAFIRDRLTEIHRHLVKLAVRDEITLVAEGGIIAPEHIAKAILCGTDAVVLDRTLLIALGFTATGRRLIPNAMDVEWGTQRILNLMNAYRDQLLEVAGAMGIRDIRRMRGEMGRAMFQADLEREFIEALENPIPLLTKEKLQAEVSQSPAHLISIPEAKPAPLQDMYRRPIGVAKVIRADSCIHCGICVKLCPFGVHIRPDGYKRVLPPLDDLCIGEKCKEKDFYCINKCPVDALFLVRSPHIDTLGDARWTPELILSNWYMSETGTAPEHLEYKVGQSGGGLDKLRFTFELPVNSEDTGAKKLQNEELKSSSVQPNHSKPTVKSPHPPTKISTALMLNRRSDGPRIVIPIPIYGGGMSFGSIGITTMLGRAKAAKEWNTFVSTGEGGYPAEIQVYDDHIITQVATGLFGVKEDTLKRVRIIEFKYAQGAKPGLGGHLLADKNTPVVAEQREAVPGTSLFSPFPFHSVYSVEDHRKHVDWLKATNPNALVSVKVSTPTDVDMVAIGIYYAGAHIIHLDGGYGGTGAAPEIAKKNIAMPIEFAIPKVHRYLLQEGVRHKVVLMVSGGIRTAYDVAKCIALGADGAIIGTAELVAMGCVRCGNCESGRGCPKGITTTDPELYPLIPENWGAQRIINLYIAWHHQLCHILQNLGMTDIRELVGRTDTLRYLEN